ncbi:MAG: InlB B-repeat-containing protein [Acutalibacteraceae bacterium]|nr:InlB B-repeat-containing protein [Acutalibacteraceae bacterium]
MAGFHVGGFVGALNEAGGKLIIENCHSEAKLTQYKSSFKSPGQFVGKYRIEYNSIDNLDIKNSYAVSDFDFGPAPYTVGSDVYKPNFTNCYTTNADSTETGVTILTEAQMKGDNAKTNMSGLDFVGTGNSDPIWRVVPGDFPELQVFPEVQTGPADQEAPQFAGEISSVGTTKTSITVTWPEATDNITPSAFISYEVFWSESQIDAGNVAAATSLGTYKFTREATLIGTDTSKDYYFAVKATDESGNETLLYGTTGLKSKASENNVWSGKVAGYYEEGTGTKDDPFVIVNAEQLAYFVKNATQASTEGKYFVIKNDMILNDVSDANWKNNSPKQWIYGNYAITASTFCGHLDAQGHVVKGLYSTGYGTRVGLIPEIKRHAVVENLGFVDSYIDIENESSTAYVGTLAGISGGTNIVDGDPDKQGVRLIRCFVDETVEVYGTQGANNSVFAAGLIGAIQQGRGDAAKTRYTTLTDCYAGAHVGGSRPFAFVGDTYCEKDTMVFERCFTHLLQTSFCFNWNKDAVKLVDCYSAGKTVDYVEEGVTTLEIIKMIGKDAYKALDKLSYNDVWVTTENGSPMLKVFTTGRTADEYEPFALNRLPVTVTFATNGADEIEPMVGYVGDKLTLPTITREGYEFEGWYLYSADSSLPYPIDFFPSFDLTLFAKWRDLSTLRVDFETYPYIDPGVDGLGEDYAWYRPGVEGYNAIYVHTGGRSLHRLGQLDSEQSFQLFDVDSNKLEVGKKYELTLWVYADKVTSGKIMLESSDRLKISQKSTVIGDIVDVTALKVGEWQQVKCTFTAQNPYVLIRTSGSNSLYFDDISIYEKGVGTLPVTDTNTNTNTGNKTDASYDSETKTGESNAIVIGFVVLAASALMMAVVILLKKKQFRGEK